MEYSGVRTASFNAVHKMNLSVDGIYVGHTLFQRGDPNAIDLFYHMLQWHKDGTLYPHSQPLPFPHPLPYLVPARTAPVAVTPTAPPS